MRADADGSITRSPMGPAISRHHQPPEGSYKVVVRRYRVEAVGAVATDPHPAAVVGAVQVVVRAAAVVAAIADGRAEEHPQHKSTATTAKPIYQRRSTSRSFGVRGSLKSP